MASLVNPLAQARGEGMMTAELRELCEAEIKEMSEVYGISNEKGWMECRDLLAGETAEEKQLDYATRTKALYETQRFLEQGDTARSTLEQMLKDFGERRPEAVEMPPAQAQKSVQPPEEVRNLPEVDRLDPLVRQPVLVSNALKAFQAMSPQRRGELLMRDNQPLFDEPMEVALRRLKAFTYSRGSGGILPTDLMEMPYQLISNLDFFNIYPEAGSIIRYFPAPDPVLASDTGRARVRRRGEAINEVTADSQLVTRVKHPISVYAEIPREDIRDHGTVLPRTRDELDIAMRQEMERQIFIGDNANYDWAGFLPTLTTAAANIGAVAINTTSVPVLTSGVREPISFFEQLMVELGMRDDSLPNVIFCNAATIELVRQSQRILRNQMQDYQRFPYGQIRMCALRPCRYLGANEAVIMQSMACFRVVTGQNVEYATSDHVAFKTNNLGLRLNVDGNLAIERPLCAIKVTGTNNFQAAT